MYPETVPASWAQERLTECCGAVAPVPLRPTIGDVGALVENVRFADAVPLAVGANTTLKGTDFPAAIVIGSVIPEILNSPSVDEAPETVTLAPLAVSEAA